MQGWQWSTTDALFLTPLAPSRVVLIVLEGAMNINVIFCMNVHFMFK